MRCSRAAMIGGALLTVMIGGMAMAMTWNMSPTLKKERFEWCLRSHDMDVTADQIIEGCNVVLRSKRVSRDTRVEALFNRAAAYARKGEHDDAIDDLGWAIRLDPANTKAYAARCLARTIIGQFEAALADCNRAVGLSPAVAGLHNRGLIRLRMGDYDSAIEDYDSAMAMAMDQHRQLPDCLFGRGVARLKKGDQAGGTADIAAATAIDPAITARYSTYGVQL